MPTLIRLVDRIVVGVGVPVGADAGLVGIPPVRGDGPRHVRIIVARVDIEKATLGVVALADVALGLGMASRLNALLAVAR